MENKHEPEIPTEPKMIEYWAGGKKVATELILIKDGEPCGWCGSTLGRSNDTDAQDGWVRCLNCGGN